MTEYKKNNNKDIEFKENHLQTHTSLNIQFGTNSARHQCIDSFDKNEGNMKITTINNISPNDFKGACRQNNNKKSLFSEH